MEAMRAMILAAGRGKRSLPEQYDLPKALRRVRPVGTNAVRDDAEMPGVSTPEELAACEAILHTKEEQDR